MSSDSSSSRRRWLLVALTLGTFFFLLGGRSLNEPDEGRYSEIAREMLEGGDWLVPHFWYAPHLDKPPLTYWAVAASMKVFGQNEWAVRLPLALAGLSGVWAAALLGAALGGRRAGWWSAVILQTCLLYFAMARMLTTDMFLTQFVTWAIYFFWRSQMEISNLKFQISNAEAQSTAGDLLPRPAERGEGWGEGRISKLASSPQPSPPLGEERGKKSAGMSWRGFGWQLAAWAAMGGGFMVKGPVALAVPLAALLALLVYRRDEPDRRRRVLAGLPAGLVLFALIVVPWFWLLSRAVPGALHYMVFGQAMGHLLGTTIKNRHGSPFYFVAILAVGFLPWTPLLGWLWRRAHWQTLSARQRDGWVMLTACAAFTFMIFSFSYSKLPAYILPLFPSLAALVAARWFTGEAAAVATVPAAVWRVVMICPLLLMAAIPLLLRFGLQAWNPVCFPPMVALGMVGLVAVWVVGRDWPAQTCIHMAVKLALVNLIVFVAVLPTVENDLRSNQTLKLIGAALKHEYRPGDIIVCQNRLPQGLPFYAGSVINPKNRPYFAGMDWNRVPFEFTGNRERFGRLLLTNDAACKKLLDGPARVLVVGCNSQPDWPQPWMPARPLRLLYREGQWDLFSNR